MAFNTNTQRNTETNNNNEAWKAQGFLNIYLPRKDGSRVKLGAIPLRETRVNERQILDWLKQDDDSGNRLRTLVNKIEFEFNTAEPKEGSALDLD